MHIVDEASQPLFLFLLFVFSFLFFFFFVEHTLSIVAVVVVVGDDGGALSTSFYEGSQHFSIYFQCFSQKKK